MNQLFYNIAGGIVHQIRGERRTTISEVIVAFHPTVKRIATALMPSLLFRCFSFFLPHLRTLAQEKRSQNCLRFGAGGPSLCVCIHYNIFPRANNGRSREKKFWRSDLLTLSACTFGILSTLTYTEFDWVALLAML